MKRILLYSLVLVFGNNLVAQTQMGATMNATSSADLFGGFVSISSNGNRFVVGSSDNTVSSATKGYAKVYEYNGSVWSALGADILEETNGDNGGTVASSGDGARIIVGAYLND